MSITPEQYYERQRQDAAVLDSLAAEQFCAARRDYAIRALEKLPQGLLKTFDLSRHPKPTSHGKVIGWKPQSIGLTLTGPTGTGKTRSLLELIRILAERGDAVSFQTAPKLADRFSSLAFESVGDLDRFLRGLERSEVLAIDDLGAFRSSERVAACFHRVFDTRYAEGRPTLITTNSTPAELQRQMQDPHGRTVRRIAESGYEVPF